MPWFEIEKPCDDDDDEQEQHDEHDEDDEKEMHRLRWTGCDILFRCCY